MVFFSLTAGAPRLFNIPQAPSRAAEPAEARGQGAELKIAEKRIVRWISHSVGLLISDLHCSAMLAGACTS